MLVFNGYGVADVLASGNWLDKDFDTLMDKDSYGYQNCLNNQGNATVCIPGVQVSDLMIFFKQIYEKNSGLMNTLCAQVRIPKIIHQIWLGSKVPKCYLAWRKSWQKFHPGWIYILWTDKEVNNLKLYNQDYFNKARNFGEKANVLRYELLYQFGGVYADIDFECLKSFDVFHHSFDFYTGIAPLDCNIAYLNNAIIGSIPGHPILKHCIETIADDMCIEKEIRARTRVTNACTGPIHFTKSFYQVAKDNDDCVIALPSAMLYPLKHSQVDAGVIGDEFKRRKEVFAVHYWAGKNLTPCKKNLKKH